MVCGEEMRLVQTVPDETMIVPGFEHHILNCPSCHDEERRLVFIRQPEPLSPPIQTDGIEPDFLDATHTTRWRPCSHGWRTARVQQRHVGGNAPD
jgi:hypothetical protein